MTARRMIVIVTSCALVVGAAFVLLWSVATTSTARLTASTSGSGSFSAGTVELEQPETSVALLFDADGLYPGRQVSSCVSIAYEGSVPADIRLHASWSGGTGLEEHVELRLTQSSSGTCDEAGDEANSAESPSTDQVPDELTAVDPIPFELTAVDPAPEGLAPDDPAPEGTAAAAPVYTGLLGELWRAHPDYDNGLVLVERAEQGDRLLLDAVVEMVGGDEAQGLTTEFAIIIEARP
jgi:hypothetical protein